MTEEENLSRSRRKSPLTVPANVFYIEIHYWENLNISWGLTCSHSFSHSVSLDLSCSPLPAASFIAVCLHTLRCEMLAVACVSGMARKRWLCMEKPFTLPRWTPRVLSRFISDVMCLCRLNLDTLTQKWVIEVRLNPRCPVIPSGPFSTVLEGFLLHMWTPGMWMCQVVTGNHIIFHLSLSLSQVFAFLSLKLPSFAEVNHNGWTGSSAFVWV